MRERKRERKNMDNRESECGEEAKLSGEIYGFSLRVNELISR